MVTLLLTLGLLPPAAAAEPADPCDLLFVPHSLQLQCTVQRGGDDWHMVIRPEDSAFGALSELSVEPVADPIEDPRAWLDNQLSLDLSGVEQMVRELTESDDSPFTDDQVARSLETWLGMMTMLADLPLQSCAEPVALSGRRFEDAAELACDWELGPFRQYLLIRLVERDGQRYAVRVRAMNERRLRHLVAIANSL
jgi:hypothetical protein